MITVFVQGSTGEDLHKERLKSVSLLLKRLIEYANPAQTVPEERIDDEIAIVYRPEAPIHRWVVLPPNVTPNHWYYFREWAFKDSFTVPNSRSSQVLLTDLYLLGHQLEAVKFRNYVVNRMCELHAPPNSFDISLPQVLRLRDPSHGPKENEMLKYLVTQLAWQMDQGDCATYTHGKAFRRIMESCPFAQRVLWAELGRFRSGRALVKKGGSEKEAL